MGKWLESSINFSTLLQFSSVAQSCPNLCDPMNRSTPGLPVHHHLPEFTQTHVHWVTDAIQQSHPWLSPSPPASNPSQHQSLFQWVNSMSFLELTFHWMTVLLLQNQLNIQIQITWLSLWKQNGILTEKTCLWCIGKNSIRTNTLIQKKNKPRKRIHTTDIYANYI